MILVMIRGINVGMSRIDNINSIASTASLRSETAQASYDAAQLGGLQTPLIEQAKSFASGLAAAHAATPAQQVQLENHALSFAREAKALRVGSIDQDTSAVENQIAEAFAIGAEKADGLLGSVFSQMDRVSTALSLAAKILSEAPAAPLVPVGN
jgi:hypothetical protein